MVIACQPAPAPLRLGTTYTVQQSGALAVLESLWTGPRFTTVVAPSGQILRAAANGDLDVVITHAPALERRLLVAPGLAVLRCPLVASRFAIVGPAADPARVAAVPSAAAAFRRIAAVGAPFVSRGDSSGTHVKELALWQAAGVTPADGHIGDIRLAVGCVGPRALRLPELEEKLRGVTPLDARRQIADSASYLEDRLQPVDDLLGAADYKIHVTGVLLARAVEQALARTGGPR